MKGISYKPNCYPKFVIEDLSGFVDLFAVYKLSTFLLS